MPEPKSPPGFGTWYPWISTYRHLTTPKPKKKGSFRYVRIITGRPLLVRMDSGYDSLDNIKLMFKKETQADFIIKRNLRKESPEAWLAIAKQQGMCCLEQANFFVGVISTFDFLITLVIPQSIHVITLNHRI